MLNRLPMTLPPFQMMLDDIGAPTVKEIARALKVSETTVRKWLRNDNAPHPVMLSIFWVTRWGVSVIDCEAHNAAVMSAGQARERQEMVESLEKRIQRLTQIANFGSANDPAPGVVPLASMPLGVSKDGQNAVEDGFQPDHFRVEKTELNPASMRVSDGLEIFEKMRK